MPIAKAKEKQLHPPPEKAVSDWHGGILRMYILHKLLKEPQSGYGLMESLQATTEGAWRPGPGSVYPILKELEKTGLVEAQKRAGRSKQVYTITREGRHELEDTRDLIDKYSFQGWQKIRGLMLEFMSPKKLAERIKGGSDYQQLMWDKVLASSEISEKEKTFFLKEYKLQVERQLDWVNSKLSEYE